MTPPPLLALDAVTLAVGRRTILAAVDLELRAGELAVLVGPNGAGKSTLLKAMTGELRPKRGAVRLDGRPLADWPAPALARRRAVLPQTSRLAFPFTVTEVVRLGLEARGGLAPAERAAEAAAVLARVELAGFGARRYDELSGGEQQRVHLARVLAQVGPPCGRDGAARLLFLDEPTASLDIRHQIGVLAVARAFARAGGAVLAVLHDLNLAGAYADRLLVLGQGRLAADGPPAGVLVPAVLEPVFGLSLRLHPGAPGRPPLVMPQAFG